jgi:Ohr subfamily peroxiredoxin
MTILYTAKASVSAGREGHAATDDKKIDVALSPPGSNGPGTNPEQLFACGYAGCFGEALKAMSKKEGLTPSSVMVHSTVDLNKDDTGFFITVALNAELPGLSQADAEKVTGLAHQICPYSKATRGNIVVNLHVNGQPLQAKAA